jgi:hypothetical protein
VTRSWLDTGRGQLLRNESLFREVNGRLFDLYSTLDGSGMQSFVCECGDGDCADTISLTLSEYSAVHEHPTRYVLAEGHEDVSLERVVAQNLRFMVVEKSVSA